ncbi:hypothetical protein D8M21_01980 [Kocuria sp. HSID16901]|nr:hypothetical protein D8M21_01980 [Kocuria sp. HSID16901]
MNHTGPEIIPALLVLACVFPALVHHLAGRFTPFTRDPIDLYQEVIRNAVRALIRGRHTRR